MAHGILVLLDWRLPDCGGLPLLQRIKDRNDCPVIVLSVMDDEHGLFTLSQTTRRLVVGDTTHQLASAEVRLLAIFLCHIDEVLDRNLLTRSVCHREWSHNDRSIDVLVARLRKRIERDPKVPSREDPSKYGRTLRGSWPDRRLHAGGA